MASKLADRVRKVRIQSNVENPAQGFALRTLLQSNVDDLLLHMQAVFDKASSSTSYIHIDRLRLDLNLDEELVDNKEALFKAISQHFSRELQQKVNAHASIFEKGAKDECSDDAIAFQANSQAMKNQNHQSVGQNISKVRQVSKEQNVLIAFIHFLHNGTLPWHEIPSAEIQSAWQMLTESRQQKALISAKITSFVAQQRWLFFLVNHHSREAVMDCIKTSMAKLEDFEYAFIEDLLSEITQGQTGLNLHQTMATNNALSDCVDVIATLTRVNDSNIPSPVKKHTVALLNKRLGKDLDDRIVEKLRTRHLKDSVQSSALESKPDLKKKPVNSETEQADPTQTRNAMRVSYAGLILFAPYLPRLFDNQGWLDEQKAIKQLHLVTAAKALCYLCCGKASLPEYQLTLIKVALAIHPEDLLLIDTVSLPVKLQDDLDLLSQSLIMHWAKLGNTSIDGLRNTFINRSGLLAQQPEAWELKIERKAFDVMLDFLPFSISTIKLPWLAHPIQLSW